MKMNSFAVLASALFIALLQVSQAGPLRLQKRAAFYIANETDDLDKVLQTKSPSDEQNYAVTTGNSEEKSGLLKWGRIKRSHYGPAVEEGEDIEAIIRSILKDEFAKMREREAAGLEPENKRMSIESVAGQSVRIGTKIQVHPLHPDAVPEEVLKEMGIYKGAELQKKMEIFKNMYEKNMRIDQNDDSIIQYPNGNFAPPGSVCLFGGPEEKFETFDKATEKPSQEPSSKATRQPSFTGEEAANGGKSTQTQETTPYVLSGHENKYDIIRSFVRGHFSGHEPGREYEDFIRSGIPEQKIPVLKTGKSIISPLTQEKGDTEEETQEDDEGNYAPESAGDYDEEQTNIRGIPPMLRPTGVGVGTIEILPHPGTPPPDVLREILMFAMTYENKFGSTTSNPLKAAELVK